ncbi:permease [Thioclava dalianensis]|uniref:Permease n=1 Tax=Thioclava dalianensis TaxID=1185766 RepID=A0A074TEH3_9RHOB|nr:DMT family transporter [Thioclava dalianensis]KEP68575.1 permease [Thioclava dalianensis]
MTVLSPTAPATLPRESTAFGLSALAALFWGSNFEATRFVLNDLPPWTAAAGRFAIAATAILLWLALRHGINLRVLRRNWRAFVTLGVLGVAGFNAALFLGLQTASPVSGALIMATSPLSTSLIDALIERRRPRAIALLGMVISLLGVGLTVGAFSGTHFASGDWLILVGSLGWALYPIGCRRWVRDASPIETASWTMVSGAVALAIAAFAFEQPLHGLATASSATWEALIWMALAGSVLAYLFWQTGIARRGPGPTSILFNLVPVSALVIAAAFGEIPNASQLAGVAVAIFGVLLASGRLRLPHRA